MCNFGEKTTSAAAKYGRFPTPRPSGLPEAILNNHGRIEQINPAINDLILSVV
jgi:hypothetical protein